MKIRHCGASLFQRLRYEDGIDDSTNIREGAEPLGYIIEHLGKLLNTRQGNVQTDLVYGLPDFNDVACYHANSAEEIARAIRQCLDSFEPRLKNVTVEPMQCKEPIDGLRFNVTAKLDVAGETSQIFFETLLNADGKATVRG